MSQQHAGNIQLTRNSYRLPITLIGEIHQYLSQQPAAQVRNMLNSIDAQLLTDEKAQQQEEEVAKRLAATRDNVPTAEEAVNTVAANG